MINLGAVAGLVAVAGTVADDKDIKIQRYKDTKIQRFKDIKVGS